MPTTQATIKLSDLQKIKIRIALRTLSFETERLEWERSDGKLASDAFKASLDNLLNAQVEEVIAIVEGMEDF